MDVVFGTSQSLKEHDFPTQQFCWLGFHGYMV